MYKKYLLNRYVIILISFGVWMYFFDNNSIQIRQELNSEIDKMETSISFFEKEIEKDKKIIADYDNPEKLEKFARETYKMKKDNEDVYIIESGE